MYQYQCPKCDNWVEIPGKKNGDPPYTPTCNNHEAHHHPRGELMKHTGTKEKRTR